uniref:ZPR1 jelly-roll domain-containing protein n=1 Tax=Callorhinchus milii TaxID=7868 RepID=A0A4W3GCD1_CALMI
GHTHCTDCISTRLPCVPCGCGFLPIAVSERLMPFSPCCPQIVEKNPFIVGDSITSDRSEKLQEFGDKLSEVRTHVVLDDPAGNSYLQNLYAPDPDPELKIEKYERSFEQNDDLGLNDMKTEDYAEPAEH